MRAIRKSNRPIPFSGQAPFLRRIVTVPILLVVTLAVGLAQTTEPPSPSDPATIDFIFAVDLSFSTRNQAPTIRNTVYDLVAGGLGGAMRPGSTLALWTFNDAVRPNDFQTRSWNHETRTDLAVAMADFLRGQNHRGTSDLSAVVRSLSRIARTQPALTVFVITDGEDPIKGSPFDHELNSVFDQHRRNMRRMRRPFIATLVAQGGLWKGWSISAGADSIDIPIVVDAPPIAPPVVNPDVILPVEAETLVTTIPESPVDLIPSDAEHTPPSPMPKPVEEAAVETEKYDSAIAPAPAIATPEGGNSDHSDLLDSTAIPLQTSSEPTLPSAASSSVVTSPDQDQPTVEVEVEVEKDTATRAAATDRSTPAEQPVGETEPTDLTLGSQTPESQTSARPTTDTSPATAGLESPVPTEIDSPDPPISVTKRPAAVVSPSPPVEERTESLNPKPEVATATLPPEHEPEAAKGLAIASERGFDSFILPTVALILVISALLIGLLIRHRHSSGRSRRSGSLISRSLEDHSSPP